MWEAGECITVEVFIQQMLNRPLLSFFFFFSWRSISSSLKEMTLNSNKKFVNPLGRFAPPPLPSLAKKKRRKRTNLIFTWMVITVYNQGCICFTSSSLRKLLLLHTKEYFDFFKTSFSLTRQSKYHFIFICNNHERWRMKPWLNCVQNQPTAP